MKVSGREAAGKAKLGSKGWKFLRNLLPRFGKNGKTWFQGLEKTWKMGSKVWKTREVMGRWVLNGKPIEVEDGAVFFIVQKCPNEAMFPVEVSFEAAS